MVDIKVFSGKIIVSRKFYKKACCFGTQEYEILQKVKQDNPECLVESREIKVNTHQEHYRGLTYDYMRWYISKYEPEETRESALKELDDMLDISYCHSLTNRYPVVKQWFLDKYPDISRFGLPATNDGNSESAELPKVRTVPEEIDKAG